MCLLLADVAAGSYLYQWPSQRVKTQAALAHLLTAAAGDTAAVAGSHTAASSSGNSSNVHLEVVVESLVRDLLTYTLRQLTPQEVCNVLQTYVILCQSSMS